MTITQQSLNAIRQHLLDISKRNQLLNYKEKARTVHVVNTPLEKVFKKLVQDGKSMAFVATPLSKKLQETQLQTPHPEEILERRCKKLAQLARSAIEETGSNLLYLAVGFLEDASLKAPLILIPVKLERTHHYALSYCDEDIEINLSLAEKLASDFNLQLPVFDDEPENYLALVAELMPHWQVVPDIRLDLFSFSKLLMYKDLEAEHWLENVNIKQILGGINVIAQSEIHGSIDSHPLADKTPLILDADSSQHAVIMDALWTRKNIVIEGPPGTGKSQTISNLIAAALSQGQSVLFVAEKKAALDVVRSRLDQVGLGEFCLELHSHKTQKAELHADLNKRLNQEYCDVSQSVRDELSAQKRQLLAYSQIMNSVVGPNDERIYEIFWAVERLRSELGDERLHFEVVTHSEFNYKINKLTELGQEYESLSNEAIQHWQGFKPIQIWPGDEETIQHILSTLFLETQAHQAYLTVLIEETKIPLTQDLAYLQSLAKIDAAQLISMPTPFNSWAALKFLDKEAVEKFRKFQAAQREFRQLLNQAIKFLGHGRYSVNFLQQLIHTTSKLENLGFGNESPDELMLFVKSVDKLDEELQSLLNSPESVEHFLQFLKLRELAEQAPEDLVLNKHPAHALEATSVIFQHARDTFSQLAKQWAAQKNDFLLSKLPNSEQLAILADELRKYQGNWLAFLSADYWRTRRAIKSFLATSKSLDLIKRLEGLAALKRETEQETVRAQYQRVFGPLFMGLETDWGLLEQHVEWAQNLAQVQGDPEKARTLLATQADPRGYLLKTTAVMYEQWLRVTKAAEQLKVPVDSHLLVNQFVENLFEQRRLVFQLASVLLQKLPHLSDKHVVSIHGAVQNLLSAWYIRDNADKNQFIKELFGKTNYRGIETDLTAFSAIADWIIHLQSVVPPPLLHWLVSEEPAVRLSIFQKLLDKNKAYLDQFSEQRRQLANFGELDSQLWFDQCTLEQIATRVQSCQASINALVNLATFYRLKQEVDDMGLENITEAIITGKIKPTHAPLHFQYAFYQGMARELIRDHAILANFTRSGYENLRQRFAQLDKELLKVTRQQIAYQVARRTIPQGNGTGRVGTFSEKCLIVHELNKKRRHIPIRQLVRRASQALQALKPCFMMSPLSVAQYLAPGQIEFDLLIMDEASQVRPEDALGAIARCRQIVIVGDPKQLPPTQFFERLVNEEDEETVFDGQESILDICLSTYQKGRLRWHYRSEHESLIAFSNRHFYDNELIVFPAPQTQAYGVHLNYVENGTYFKGRNQKEAEAVAAAVKGHFRNTPHLSLGVATFNSKQQELIAEVLDSWLEAQRNTIEKSAEPFFIKNLENVQGDERDVIFVSTTYGADPDSGRVFQRFGPISRDMGWRRLNVIFSRAKKRLELFTSMRSSDIQLKSDSKRGVRILKMYLEYAETLRSRLQTCSGKKEEAETGYDGRVTSKEADSDFQIAISKILEVQGYKTVPNVGVAGFRID
ncbi:MAG: DUF4011 domain-containing protein, partial [Pseudomonadota bacterium]